MADFDYLPTSFPKPGSSSYLAAIQIANSGTIATGGLVINKTSRVLRIPKGFVLTGIKLRLGDGDSNGAPALVQKLGDAADDDRFVTASTIGQAGGETTTLDDAGLLYEFTADTDILLKTSTAAATAAAQAFKVVATGYMK